MLTTVSWQGYVPGNRDDAQTTCNKNSIMTEQRRSSERRWSPRTFEATTNSTVLTDVVIAVVITVVTGALAVVRATEDVVVAKDVSMFASDDVSAVVVMAEKGGTEGGVGNDTLVPSVITTVAESVLTSNVVPKLCT